MMMMMMMMQAAMMMTMLMTATMMMLCYVGRSCLRQNIDNDKCEVRVNE